MNNFAQLEMSVRQGAKLWNIAPNTIYDRIRKKELQLNENWKISPSEMTRVFGNPKPNKNKNWTIQKIHWTAQTEQFWITQIALLEQSLNFEQQRNKDLQQQLNDTKQQIQTQEKHIFELLQTIKDLSQSVKLLEPPKQRKKFLGIF